MFDFYVNRYSPIHETDPRVKLILTLGFITFVNLTPQGAWPVYILFLSFVLSLAIASRIGMRLFLSRTLLVIPFMVAALPLVFGNSDDQINILLPYNLAIGFSRVGTVRFFSILIKSWISVQCAVLLVATTRFSDLLIALNALKIPDVLITTIRLMWRYLFVLVDEVSRMMRARKSRCGKLDNQHKTGGTLFWRAHITGNMAGSLFIRSIERSERVYSAMLSRGYNGQLPISETRTLNKQERSLIITGFMLFFLLWFFGFLIGG